MTKNEIQEKLAMIKKLVFGGTPAPAPDPVPAPAPAPTPAPVPVEYKTKDGQVLSIDTLEVGGIVTINGEPAPDAEYQLESGQNVQTSGGAIVELSSPNEDVLPEEMKTTEQMMAAIQKFAEPGATPDLAKMATILKACFESVFGWQLREVQERATRDAAIQAYQTGFAAQKETIEKQDQALKLMFELVEKFGEQPVVAPKETVDSNNLTNYQKLLKARGEL